MLTLFRDSAHPAPPLLPPPIPGPDYDELASFLNKFLSPPDNFGEISISSDEANNFAASVGPLALALGAPR